MVGEILLQSMGLQRVGHDRATEWQQTDGKIVKSSFCGSSHTQRGLLGGGYTQILAALCSPGERVQRRGQVQAEPFPCSDVRSCSIISDISMWASGWTDAGSRPGSSTWLAVWP